MARRDEKPKADPLAELQRIKDEFAAQMRDLRRRQRSAIEKAEKAIDARKAAKLRKTIDDIAN